MAKTMSIPTTKERSESMIPYSSFFYNQKKSIIFPASTNVLDKHSYLKKITVVTGNMPNNPFSCNMTALTFLWSAGSRSSFMNLLTSTKFLPAIIQSKLLTCRLKLWLIVSRSTPKLLKPIVLSLIMANKLQPRTDTLMQCSISTHTMSRNFPNMLNISLKYLLLSNQLLSPMSLTMIKLSGLIFPIGMTPSLQISLATCTPSILAMKEQHLLYLLQEHKLYEENLQKSAKDSIKTFVMPLVTVNTNIPMPSAIDCFTVSSLDLNVSSVLINNQPKFFCNFLQKSNEFTVTPSATTTETMPLLPKLPALEFLNCTAIQTIQRNSSLFSIMMPINVTCFESLLSLHPNHPLVDSIIHILCKAFWPYTDTSIYSYPDTQGKSLLQYNLFPEVASFLDTQC